MHEALGVPGDEKCEQRVGRRPGHRVIHQTIVGRTSDALCQGKPVDFSVGVAEVGGRTVVSASGELDAHAAPALEAEVGPVSTRPGCALIVDLTDVSFIDSTGLGVLVTALKHTREAGGSLDVVVAAPRVLKVLALTGLDVVIPLHATLDEALAS